MRPHHLQEAFLAIGLVMAGAAATPAPAGAPRFESDVQPLLTARCLKCHGEKKQRAGLDLTSRAGMLRGGESGPVLVPGSAEKSLLYEVIQKGEMPPRKEPKLSSEQAALLRSWIEAGAPAAGGQGERELPDRPMSLAARDFWAFRKAARSALPTVRHPEQVRTPIDAFILSRLEAKGLCLSPEAGRAALLRRLSFDLLGLPPTPAEVEAFLADTRPDAYERLVDRLLASPHYGERWGRHWLDAAGYSDSVGGDNDPGQLFPREGMWRYRDYVVRSLNEDKPYDLFLREQLAGDEMDDWRSAPAYTPSMLEHLVATGFVRTTVDHTTEDELNRPFERYQVLHDTIENLTTNLLGLTVACARCHDHKFDPIAQQEYYRLLAVLKPVYNPEKWIQPQHRHLPDVSSQQKEEMDRYNAGIDQEVAQLNEQAREVRRRCETRLSQAKLAALPEAIRADTAAALAAPAEKRSEIQKYLAAKLGPQVTVTPEEVNHALDAQAKARIAAFEQQIAAAKGRRRSWGKIQAAWEAEPGKLPATFVFRRGNLLTPGAEVGPGVFAVLADGAQTRISPALPGAKTSGRRTAWAAWLTRPDHPLTARVFVNRVWQHHFGEGIVATPDNFGHLGAPPTHPELLDWLAREFVESGWKVKALHRLIVLSSVYRQTSTALPEAVRIDPGNQLLGRMRLRRLESEAVRDTVLAISGKLDFAQGGPPVPIEPHADGMVVIPTRGLPTPTAAWRRSLYLFARRNYNLTLLSVFDQPVMATNCTRRIHSAVPLQSLTLLNDAFMLEQAGYFADRVAAVSADQQQQIATAFQVAFARAPTSHEMTVSLAFLKKLQGRYAADRLTQEQAQRQALARLCHMLLCSNELLYVG